MKSFTFTVTDPEGFHARPTGMLVKKAKEFPCEILIGKGKYNVKASRMFSLLGLNIKCGDTITVTTEGEQEEEAAAAMEAFLKENL